MISDILEINKRQELQKQSTSLTNIVVLAYQQSKPLPTGQSIHYEFKIKHSHKIFANDQKILRVVLNLLANAADACGSNGKIWVSTTEKTSSNEIIVSIKNNNSFIAPESRERIFEPYYTKGKRDGIGLGLPICKKIIDEHGGQISCSSSEERLTEFRFAIAASTEQEPVQFESMDMKTFESKDSSRLGIKNIQCASGADNADLVVLIDDDDISREDWKKHLAPKVTVVTFASEVEFLSNVSHKEFDRIKCIITDFFLGEQTGDRLAQLIRQYYSGPIFVCSNAELSSTELACFDGQLNKDEPSFSMVEFLIGKWREKKLAPRVLFPTSSKSSLTSVRTIIER